MLDHGVTEIEMNERQFWNFAQLQPVAEKPWVTFMGRLVRVPNMPEDAQKCLGVYDAQRPGVIFSGRSVHRADRERSPPIARRAPAGRGWMQVEQRVLGVRV